MYSNGKPFKIFVVEDDEWYNRLLVHTLSLNPDYEIESFFNATDCLKNLDKSPDVVTLDYRLPDMKGLEALRRIREINDEIQVILISEQDDIEVVVELLKQGAYDYIVKSKDIRERLLNTVSNIVKGSRMKQEIVSLRREVTQKYNYRNTIIGNSPATQKVFDLINRATQTNITVMISGETGTGKELVAKAIHYNSDRAAKPFVAVNMAAIPKDLVESELFGHEKGAFTGAAFRRIGKFEEAHGGTLFLDELAEMEIALQAKLLRALQEREIVRIGSNKPVRFDCRIIVATNKNLLEEVKKGNFRQDLYYRLYGLPIELPPLRDRGNDTILLAKSFVNQFCEENKIPPKTLSGSATARLLGYAFPGNIRELKSVVELAVVLADGPEITAENIMLGSHDLVDNVLSEELTLREYNIRIIKNFLKMYDNNPKLVAEKLDIGVATVYRMLKEDKESGPARD
ncbi:MAG TPA: sigma-54 dependent transcriptional regulator [Prolixibacteraceae bacterium]|nr:sigma-54 dependent transcriptional regulator [Prolixibacteraceae bacterium]